MPKVASSLLATGLCVSPARPTLADRLNAAIAIPLTLIYAPAGFGGTILVRGIDSAPFWPGNRYTTSAANSNCLVPPIDDAESELTGR